MNTNLLFFLGLLEQLQTVSFSLWTLWTRGWLWPILHHRIEPSIFCRYNADHRGLSLDIFLAESGFWSMSDIFWRSWYHLIGPLHHVRSRSRPWWRRIRSLKIESVHEEGRPHVWGKGANRERNLLVTQHPPPPTSPIHPLTNCQTQRQGFAVMEPKLCHSTPHQ
jgi:hypothetical protein